MKVSKRIILILALMLGISIALNFHFGARLFCTPQRTYTDTVKVEIPVPVDSLVVRYEVRQLPLISPIVPAFRLLDTIALKDTVFDSVQVLVPITQKVYAQEEYTAWVSGYEPSLDSIYLNLPAKTASSTSSWIQGTVGFQLGTSLLPGRPSVPYIGVGLQLGIPLEKIRNMANRLR